MNLSLEMKVAGGVLLLLVALLAAGFTVWKNDGVRGSFLINQGGDHSCQVATASDRDSKIGFEPKVTIKGKTVPELLSILKEAESNLGDRDLSREEEQLARREFVSKWEGAAIRSIFESVDSLSYEWGEALGYQWGRESPEEAVRFFVGISEDLPKASGGGGLPRLGYDKHFFVASCFNGALEGWSSINPHLAWSTVIDSESEVSRSHVFQVYGAYVIDGVFENLARHDFAFALDELKNQNNAKLTEPMLRGLGQGGATNHDWGDVSRNLFDHFQHMGISEGSFREVQVISVYMSTIFSRWLEQDSANAMEWHLGDQSIFGGDASKTLASPCLGEAVMNWLRRDRDSAMGWLANQLSSDWDHRHNENKAGLVLSIVERDHNEELHPKEIKNLIKLITEQSLRDKVAVDLCVKSIADPFADGTSYNRLLESLELSAQLVELNDLNLSPKASRVIESSLKNNHDKDPFDLIK